MFQLLRVHMASAKPTRWTQARIPRVVVGDHFSRSSLSSNSTEDMNKSRSDDIKEVAGSSESVSEGSDANTARSRQSPSDTDDMSVPWYLRNDIKSPLLEEKRVTLPETPPAAPSHVSEFLNLLAHDYGIENLLLFDMTVLPDDHEYKSNNTNVDFIIIGTGKSEKHILKAATEFRTHLKHQYGVIPAVEGMVSNYKSPAVRRRLLRQARKGPSSTDNEYGKAANSWVMFHHEHVDVHLMTGPRREELNLESLWCSKEDLHLYEQKTFSVEDSDNIFSGIRRFHTKAAEASEFTGHAPHVHLGKVLSSPEARSPDALKNLKHEFDTNFKNSSLAEHRTKFELYKFIHLAMPDLVSFEDVESALVAKYSCVQTLRTDMAEEKINDITEYARLILDSPSWAYTSVTSSDGALDKLSRLIALLYRFSTDKFSISANPHFVPLLWRLTYFEHGNPVTPRQVDEVITGGLRPTTGRSPEPSVTLSSNNARDVLTVLDFCKSATHAEFQFSANFRELVLFTYGNAGKWTKFWDEWNKMHFPQSVAPGAALSQWVRLVVFLSLISNRAQSLHFLRNYWKNGSSVSGTFMESYNNNGKKFSSDNEKSAFVASMESLLAPLDSGNGIFEEIRQALMRM